MAGDEILRYGEVLQQLKEKIKVAQQKAILAVNNELLTVYWEIGQSIAEQEQLAGWGGKVVDKLAIDLKAEFPDMKGLSPRNLRYMRDFSIAYPQFLILQQPAAKTGKTEADSILQQAAAKLPWGHHQLLLTKLKTIEERAFYIRKAVENAWSRSVLEHQIESGLFKTQGALVSNFSSIMPAYQSELTQQVFKDPYNFDFIMLGEQSKERDLEDALMTHVTKVLLELGAGFAFMGRQKRFDAGGREFFVDLLFYHTKLRRHVIIELKIGEFEPEFVSKMNLYLGLADDQLRGEHDEPAIGLILCKTNNKVVAEYALRDTSKPIGIAEYKIAERLPENIQGELPSIKEIEQKLDEELKEPVNPINTKLQQLKDRINQIDKGEAVKKSNDAVRQIYYQFLMPTYDRLYTHWEKDIIPLFSEYECMVFMDNTGTAFHTDTDFEARILVGSISSIRMNIQFKGFKKAGVHAFDVSAQIYVHFLDYKYKVTIRSERILAELEIIYSLLPSMEITTQFENRLYEDLIDLIHEKVDAIL